MTPDNDDAPRLDAPPADYDYAVSEDRPLSAAYVTQLRQRLENDGWRLTHDADGGYTVSQRFRWGADVSAAVGSLIICLPGDLDSPASVRNWITRKLDGLGVWSPYGGGGDAIVTPRGPDGRRAAYGNRSYCDVFIPTPNEAVPLEPVVTALNTLHGVEGANASAAPRGVFARVPRAESIGLRGMYADGETV